MMLKKNKLMNDYLLRIGFQDDFFGKNYVLSKKLNELLDHGFVELKDSVFLRDLCNAMPYLEGCEKSIYEDSENHFHPEDYLDSDVDEIEYLKMALECGKRIANKLELNYPGRKFRIVISFEESKKKNNEIEIFGSSTVRFHQIRQECESVLRVKNLDQFSEAILEIEI